MKIPGLNAPIPPGASYGYQPGGWGRPPVDERGLPLYGDAFGTAEADSDEGIDKAHWGDMVSEESESGAPVRLLPVCACGGVMELWPDQGVARVV